MLNIICSAIKCILVLSLINDRNYQFVFFQQQYNKDFY